MSIDLKDFRNGNFEKRKKSDKETQKDRILGFLKSNKRAFSTEEISKVQIGRAHV